MGKPMNVLLNYVLQRAMKNTIQIFAIICLSAALFSAQANHKSHAVINKNFLKQFVHDLLTDDWDEAIAGRECIEREKLQITEYVKNFRYEQIDFNGDGKLDIVVQSVWPCYGSMAGNGPLWVYRKINRGYQLFFKTDDVQVFYFKQKKTKRYRDLVTSVHVSAYESSLTVYQFDGNHYKKSACFYSTYRYEDKNGNFKDSKRPIISKLPCDD